MPRQPVRLMRVGQADLQNAAAFDAYVGPSGEVTVDHQRGIIALHDGATAGGIQFSPSGGGDGAPSTLGSATRATSFTVSGAAVDIPGMTVTFTATERPVVFVFGGTMKSAGTAGDLLAITLWVNGAQYSQILTAFGSFLSLTRETHPINFPVGTVVTAKLQAFTTGGVLGELYGGETDKSFLTARNA